VYDLFIGWHHAPFEPTPEAGVIEP
jgi:hypothetical protein